MESKNNRKQILELAQFDTFLGLTDQHFDEVSRGEPPEPDIIARRHSEQIGVEITNFHRRAQKRKESEGTLVVERAASLYARTRAPNVGVHVMWAPHYDIKKEIRETLARDLALLVAANLPAKGEWTDLDWRNFNHLLTIAIDHVSVNRLIEYRENFWTVSGGGAVPEWTVAALQAEIDRKNRKPKKYLERYHEKWLLIVSSFGAPSAWMELSDEVRTAQFRSTFTRVFLLSSFPVGVFELRTTQVS